MMTRFAATFWPWVLALSGACTQSALDPGNRGLGAGDDADGDGFESTASGGIDCDDDDPAVHPGAVEVCDDGLDNDCDGNIDDAGRGNLTWYRDQDGDGYGITSQSRQACPGALEEQGYSTTSGDCADTDPSIHPDLVDVCNGVDDDCDGAIDDDELARVGDESFADLASALEHVRSGSETLPVIELCPRTEPLEVDTIAWTEPKVTIQGGGASPSEVVLTHRSGGRIAAVSEGGRLVLRNVTLRDSSTDRALVVGAHGRLFLENVLVVDNPAGGIEVDSKLTAQTSPALLRIDLGSEIRRNGTPETPRGGGILARGAFDLEIESSTVAGNQAIDGGGIYLGPLAGSLPHGSSASFVDATVKDNAAGQRGGAVYAHLEEMAGEGLLVLDNAADFGAGLYLREVAYEGVCDEDSLATNKVARNAARDSGGGIYLEGVTQASCVDVVDNTASSSGGGVYVDFGAEAEIDDATIEGNTAVVGGGIMVQAGVSLAMSLVNVFRNTGTVDGGGILIDGSNGTVVTLDRVRFRQVQGSSNDPQDICVDEQSTNYSPQQHSVRCDTNGCSPL